jgi:MoaA/NifB/PqqE/SkfB family radical SAM enzyme
MKVFHYKEKIDSLPLEKESILAPIHIRIKPTNVCNHNCSYCAYRAKGLQLGQDMNVRDFIPKNKLLEILEDLNVMGVEAVTFSGGGEPFCYPYLLEAVEYLAGQTKIKIASLTNGARLTGRISELFAKHATWLRISMDGWDNKSYSLFRGVPDGEFTKIINNIREFKSYGGKCYLGISIIVNKDNASHIFELMKVLVMAGVNSVKIAPCIISNVSSENNDYHAPHFKVVKDQIAQGMAELAGQGCEIFDSLHEQLATFNKSYKWCPYMQVLPVIGADQNIYPCQDKAYNLDEGLIGSIKNMRFKDFWLSGKAKFFKINPANICNHHCVADGKNKILLEYLESDREHLPFV